MQTNLTSPYVVRNFGNNLDVCLRLIGSRPESLALRCNTSLDLILGFKQGLGTLSEQLLMIICKDIGIPKEEILLEHQSPITAELYFEGIFRRKGRLTTANRLEQTKLKETN